MKIAVTIWGNRISPVFDAASNLLVAHVEDNTVLNKTYNPFKPGAPSRFVQLLKHLDVSILICGAISKQPADTIVENQIELISFVSGNAEKVLHSFAAQKGIEKIFMMPGCSKHYSQRPGKTRSDKGATFK
ncbi:MAG: dinitrogenase iron-molybdenum cofactor biosynthesis domain-containing protein [Desulfobacteraceae bacterium]|nr:dinitrogenase iron-molybdenum cofactor biosynthesis domain-containing protein [Desulfobacteraceae bacterium]